MGLPLLPDPQREKGLFDSYLHKLDSQQRRILVNNMYPELKPVFETLDSWKISDEMIEKQLYGSRPVQIVKMGNGDRLVIKGIDRPENYGSKTREQFKRRWYDYHDTQDLLLQIAQSSGRKKSRLMEILTNNYLANIGGFSLIHQLEIGREVFHAFATKYREKLQIEEPLGAFVNLKGDKRLIYRHYPGSSGDELAWDRLPEFVKFEDLMHKRLFNLGYLCIDLQFMVIDPNRQIDTSNTVLIDTEQLVPLVSLTRNYRGKMWSLVTGELDH